MGEPFRRTDDSSHRATFVKGLLAGVVAIALVWGITYALRSPESAPEERAASQAVHAGSQVGAAKEDPRPGAGARCREVIAAQAPPRRAAAAVLAQWAVHVGAMNQLVAGKISLSQATAFWTRTRLGAKMMLARYDAAVQARSNTDVACPPEHRDALGAHSTCRRAVTAGRRELRAAATAIATWRHHVVDMEMLRMGHLSAAQASRMWLRNWRTGVAQLEDYHAARERAQSRHC